jgi:SWI/SNF-related matrix-associated actin-dependent regulator 1 of chromatin subfamily A
MNPPLRDYQLKALAFLEDGGSYLALEQGLGKSRIMIEFAKRQNARRILVFCPASVRLAWEAEIPKWWADAPPTVLVNRPSDLERREGFFIISYGLMSRNRGRFSSKKGEFTDAIDKMVCRLGRYSLAYCDEAHALKNGGAARTKSIYGDVSKYVKRMIAASGTPAPNHAGELYTALRALSPEKLQLFGGRVVSQIQFEDAFCKVDTKWFGGRAIRVIVGSQSIPQLRERLDGFLLRMTKKQVLPELPPLEFITVPIEPSIRGVDVDVIKRFDNILEQGMTDEEVLHTLGDFHENDISRLRAALGVAKVEAAIKYLIDFLGDIDTRSKIVVWAQHHVVIDKLFERLGDFRPVKIDGRSAPKDRKAAVETFLNNDRCRVFIGNIVAAGTGLTLIGPKCNCSDCFFVESSYTPGENLQAAARIHRLGQQDGVLARVFTARRTIDDRIQAIIARKTNELAEIFG